MRAGERPLNGVSVQIRVGLNSGEVVVRAIGSDLHMDYTAVGQTTHLAARMEQLAEPGTTLLTPATLALAEGFVQVIARGPVPVKGLAEPVDVCALTGANPVRSRLHAAAAQGLTRCVGRDAELEVLRRALTLAGSGRGQVVAIVGEPGVGKSGLVWEFTHSHRLQGWLCLGRLDEARSLGDRAVESSPSQLGFAAHALHLLGEIATHPDRFDAESGEAHYRQALALAEPRGMRPLVAHCHLGLAKFYRRTGQRQEAQEHLTTATTMYREMDMRFWWEQAEAEMKASA
jgi:tetratricopeptide (TPR) repeat protein